MKFILYIASGVFSYQILLELHSGVSIMTEVLLAHVSNTIIEQSKPKTD